MKRPSFQFYPDDWTGNGNLKRCSHKLKGVWMDVLCLLHDSEAEYGILRWPLREIAQACGCSVRDLQELVDKSVLKGADPGKTVEAFVYIPRSGRREGTPVTLIPEQPGPLWYSSRMVKDEYVRSVRGEGSRFEEGGPNPRKPSPDTAPKAAPKPSPNPPFGDGPPSPSPSPAPLVSDPSDPLATTPPAGGDGSPDLTGEAPPAGKPKRTRRPRAAADEPSDTAKVWRAYALAYEQVYDVPPAHSAKVMGQLAQLVVKIPAEAAPHVAAFYLRDSAYARQCHPVDLLLRDATGLHTRWQRAQRGLVDPAVATGPRLDARTQHRNDRMAEALGSYAGVAGAAPPAALSGARQPFDLEADDGPPPRAALPSPGRR